MQPLLMCIVIIKLTSKSMGVFFSGDTLFWKKKCVSACPFVVNDFAVTQSAEVESSRTSSRTHFEVLGLDLEAQVLGLDACECLKMFCPRLEDSIIF